MNHKIFYLLATCALLVASCSNEAPEEEKIEHKRPGLGSTFDMPWEAYDSLGRWLPAIRVDTVMKVVATDTTVYGRGGVTTFAMTDPQGHGGPGPSIFVRVNASNDIEAIFSADDFLLDQWVVFPVQTTSQKTLTIDTILYEGSSGQQHWVGTSQSFNDGELSTLIDGNSVSVVKLRQLVHLEIKQGTTVIATLNITKILRYAPSLGAFVYLEEVHDGYEPDGPIFEHTMQAVHQYRIR